MPIEPRAPFLKVVCQACGWQTTIRQRSDVLLCPQTCAACGSERLSRSATGHIKSLLTDPGGYVDARLRKR